MTGFMPDLGAHYGVLGELQCDAHLVGSETMRTGLTLEGPVPPDPGPVVDRPPTGREGAPYWFLVDSRGALPADLHAVRAFPGLRDVVVLIAGVTPAAYREYLAERGYPWLECGGERVDLSQALRAIHQRYGIRRMHVDAGPVLTSALWDAGLVDEVSLIVHPLVVGAGARHLFGEAHHMRHLQASSHQCLPGGLVHDRYLVTT